MILDIIRQFNWVDIFVLVILFRICYISFLGGVPSELFKIFGTVAAIYVPCHYYTFIADILVNQANFKFMQLDLLDFMIFVILSGTAYLVFALFRQLFLRFIKMEAAGSFNKWGGLCLGAGRGLLLVGLLLFMLYISSVGYLKQSVKKSYLGARLVFVAPVTYVWLWDNLMSKLMVGEKPNQTIYEVTQIKTTGK